MTVLAYVTGEGRGANDLLLAEVATRLQARGWPLAGVVQHNTEAMGQSKCDMDLQVLGRPKSVRISQRLGAGARGCRLDPAGLESAVALVEQVLTADTRLMIVNKFGKTEVEGRGFRALIGEALALGVPVLVGVKDENLPGFLEFAQGLAKALPADPDAILDWCGALTR
jgi:nucleoside-triphosphatase THEP1